MNNIPVPKNEQGRIAALKLYDILDTAPEQEFDNLAQLAAEICNTPIALISIIDEHRQWVKASVGIDVQQLPREFSFCHYTILDDEIFEVTNPLADSRFDQNPLVTGHPGIRFYAGVPLINKDNYRLGALCVMTPKHHQLNSYQRISLQILGDAVMSLIELGREKSEAAAYRAALDEVAIVAVLDANQDIVSVNDKFCKIAGLTEEEITGRNNSAIKLADVTPEQAAEQATEIAAGRTWSGVIKNQNIKGIVSWSNTTIIPFLNKDKQPVRILALRNDITQEVLLRERLEESESLAKTGSWELNIFNRQTYWTPGMYALLEFEDSGEVPADRSVMSFVSPLDFDRVNDVNKRMLEKKTHSETLEFKIITRNGTVKDISAVVKKRFNSRGGLTGIFGTLHDVTEKKIAQNLVAEQLQQYRQLYSAAPCGFITAGADGYITDINESMLGWLGYSREELVSRVKVADILQPQSRPLFEKAIKNIKKAAAADLQELLFATRSGGTLPATITPSVISNAAGEPLYIQLAVQDDSSLSEIENQLQELATKLGDLELSKKNTVSQADYMAVSFTEKGAVLFASPRLKAAIGYNDSELHGQVFPFAFDEEARKKAIAFYSRQLREKKEPATLLMPVKSMQGEKMWLELESTFITAGDTVTGFKCLVQDVTERIKTEEELHEVAWIAMEAKTAHQGVIARVSQDVRDPLGGVMGMVNLLGTTALSAEQKVLVAGIKEASGTILQALDGIADTSKKQPEKTNINGAEFELKHLVNSVIFSLKPEADKKNIRFALQIDNKIPPAVFADQARLSKILHHLIENAVEVTEKGSISVSVLQKTVTDEMITLEFTVKDTGPGMADSGIDAVLNSANGNTKGAIAGLAAAKQLTEEQNGVLKVRSKEGEGAVVSFTYHCRPARKYKASEKQPEKAPDFKQNGIPVKESGESVSLIGYNILLVEDNIMSQRVGRVTVGNWGAVVTVAERGREAIELIRRNEYDVVLMDIQMPEMSGIEAAAIIRKELKNNTPILAMTVSESQGTREMCISAGMDDYILKPLNPVELYQKIRGLLKKPDVTATDRLTNINYVRNLTDNDTLLIKEILEIYIEKTPALLDEIEDYMEGEQYKEAKAGVHYLKNSVGLLGADTLFHLMATIEDQLNYLPPSNDTLKLLVKMKEIVLLSIEETREELDNL